MANRSWPNLGKSIRNEVSDFKGCAQGFGSSNESTKNPATGKTAGRLNEERYFEDQSAAAEILGDF